MPIHELQLKAHMENVGNLMPMDPKNHQWALKLRCSGCREVSEKWRYVSAEELVDIPNSRGQAHYVEKCGFCGKHSSLNVLEDSFKPIVESDEFYTVVKFESRGTEPAEYQVGGEWQCESTVSNAEFKEIDISDSWAEYDEKGGEPVTIDELEWKFK